MEFCEIAKFLNISETAARSLGKQGVFPGQPHADGWETTLDEIEHWYVKLSGKEWADLVADGRVNPLTAKADLEDEVTPEALLAVLKSWEQRGIIRITSSKLEPSGNYEVVLTLYAAAEAGRRDIESVQHAILTETMRSQIELASRCESIIGKHPVLVTLSRQKNLKLSIEDDMADLPQREREIIRFYLARYVLRLSAELQREYTE
jgi:DNA-binding Lrp family transcriptional regulator